MNDVSAIGENNFKEILQSVDNNKGQVKFQETVNQEIKKPDKIQEDKINIEKYKLLSKIDVEHKNEEIDVTEYISQVKNYITKDKIEDLIDKKYLQGNVKDFYNLIEDKQSVGKNSPEVKVNTSVLEQNAKAMLETIENKGQDKALASRLKQLLSSTNEYPEKQKIDVYTSILLQGIMITAGGGNSNQQNISVL